MDDKWWMKVIERKQYNTKPSKWAVQGWYEGQKRDFLAMEKVWDKKRAEEWERNPHVCEWCKNGQCLCLVDDYFSWRVPSWAWYLHPNGTWHYGLSADPGKTMVLAGEYDSYRAAENVMSRASKPPARMDMTYEEFLIKYDKDWVEWNKT